MSTQSLLNRMHALDACPEAIEWMQQVRSADMHTGWAAMDSPQWMCWVAVRLLGTTALKPVVACVRQLEKLKLLPPPAIATLELALAYGDGKKSSEADEEALLTGAFDAASHGLHVAGDAGNALVAVSYTAHAAQKLVAAKKLPAGSAERRALEVKAAAHVADAVMHVLFSIPDSEKKLCDLVRSQIDEAALSKAWHAIPDKPVKAPAAPKPAAR